MRRLAGGGPSGLCSMLVGYVRVSKEVGHLAAVRLGQPLWPDRRMVGVAGAGVGIGMMAAYGADRFRADQVEGARKLSTLGAAGIENFNKLESLVEHHNKTQYQKSLDGLVREHQGTNQFIEAAERYGNASMVEKPFIAFKSAPAATKIGMGIAIAATSLGVARLVNGWRGNDPGKSFVDRIDSERQSATGQTR